MTKRPTKFPMWLDVYGDFSYRGDCPPESAEQKTFFNWIRREHAATYGVIALHPRNEGRRSYGTAWHETAEGMAIGASDIIIPGCPSFVCELKRRDHTKCKLSNEQLGYLLASKTAGSFVCVALGADAARDAFFAWMSAISSSRRPVV
jgi:hypothetical protein